MCGRSSLTLTEKELEKQFGKSFYSDEVNRYNPIPNYNIAPTHYVPIITNDDKNHFQYSRWGLLPQWAKDKNYGSRLINARVETIEKKASFKSSFQKRRCLIPMSGYYEWLTKNGKKYPYRIMNMDRSPFLVAGIWSIWESPSGEKIPSFSVVTRDAAEKIDFIHDRMPAILSGGTEMNWLDMEFPSDDVKSMIYDLDGNTLSAYPVTRKVNSVKNNDKSLIEEVDPPEIQLSLF